MRRPAPTLTTGDALRLAAALPTVVVVSAVMERWVLMSLIQRFDTIREYIFLVAIGWCLGVSQLGHAMGLSHEIGAFVAGVALARSPIATFIAESLKPLRDFFLVMFFFALGAGFPIPVLAQVAFPAACLGGLMLVLKPAVFRWLLRRERESSRLSREIGVRLGQLSEFSLLIAVIASRGEGHRRERRIHHPRGHAPHVHRVELHDHVALPRPRSRSPTPCGGTEGRPARTAPAAAVLPALVR